MNWLDFRSKIICCHVEVAIVVLSFFILLHVQGLFFLDYLVISTILKPTIIIILHNCALICCNLSTPFGPSFLKAD